MSDSCLIFSFIYIYYVHKNCHPAAVTQVLKSEVMSCLTHPCKLRSMIYPTVTWLSTCLMAATDPVMQDLSVSQLHGSSSSVEPMANTTDVLQPSRLIVLTLSPPVCLDVQTFSARYPHVPNDARDPSSERWNCVGENWPVILPEIVTFTSIQGSFTCHKSVTWDPRLYFPSKGRRAEDPQHG